MKKNELIKIEKKIHHLIFLWTKIKYQQTILLTNDNPTKSITINFKNNHSYQLTISITHIIIKEKTVLNTQTTTFCLQKFKVNNNTQDIFNQKLHFFTKTKNKDLNQWLILIQNMITQLKEIQFEIKKTKAELIPLLLAISSKNPFHLFITQQKIPEKKLKVIKKNKPKQLIHIHWLTKNRKKLQIKDQTKLSKNNCLPQQKIMLKKVLQNNKKELYIELLKKYKKRIKKNIEKKLINTQRVNTLETINIHIKNRFFNNIKNTKKELYKITQLNKFHQLNSLIKKYKKTIKKIQTEINQKTPSPLTSNKQTFKTTKFKNMLIKTQLSSEKEWIKEIESKEKKNQSHYKLNR